MNKHILIITIIALVLTGSGYILSQAMKNSNMHGGHGPIVKSHRSYEMEVTEKPENIQPGNPAVLKYKIINDKGEVVKGFAVAHEKIMHFIVVRKDLSEFQHLHPDFDEKTGEFSVKVVFPTDGPYRFFADFTPEEDNPQKLPVTVSSDITAGNELGSELHELIVDLEKEKTVSPNYEVNYGLPSDINSQKPFSYTLVVTKNGQPVTLENYLGARGHSVILKEETLDYIHTHAEEHGYANHGGQAVSEAKMAPNAITFTTTFPESGIYKIFTQIQHEGKVLTTDYVVAIK